MEVTKLEVDLEAVLDRIKEKGQAVSEWRFQGISDVYEISLAVSEALAKDDFSIFSNCFESLGSWRKKWETPEKNLMVKYALLMHLCIFFHEKLSQTIQEQARVLLRSIALDEEHSRWRSDHVLCGSLLEVIATIAVRCNCHEAMCFNIFNQMLFCAHEVQSKAIEDFLCNETFEDKVRNQQTQRNEETYVPLFDIVKARAGIHQTHSIYKRNQELLKENYKDDTFAKVPLIMGLHQEKHVKDFDFNLVVYEKVLIQNQNRGPIDQNEYNQVHDNVKRTTLIRKPITIRNIFEQQDEIFGGPLDKNRIVLVIGNPGTGKTSLSKRLCYDWANGKWGSMFMHVYLLRIRQLSRISQGPHMDLIHAIVNLYYNPDHQHGYIEAIYAEVRDCLRDKTTLLILDGLDEGDQAAWKFVHLSLEQPCSLLLLSRPHNVQRIRDKADIEIECLEFSDEHLKNFISKELPQEDVEEFSQFLNQSSSIWEVARVPINVQIICNMWTSSAKEELKTINIMNLGWLYDQMVNYVWMRYIKKEDINVNSGERDLVLSSLENLVNEHSNTDSHDILRDTGFLLFVQEGQVFQFAHLTFHEYFASRHLAKLLDSNNDREKRKARRFICENKYRDTSRVVFAFMIDIYCRDDDVEESLECFKKIINILDNDPIEPIGWQNTFLKMRTLDTFLTCCPNTDELRVVKDWVQIQWGDFLFQNGMYVTHRHFWDRIIDDLGNMPNLHREYKCFLEMILNIKDIEGFYSYGNLDQIVKIAKFNPLVHKIVPPIPNELEYYTWRSWIYWMHIFSKINEECATDALSHLLEAYKRFGEDVCEYLIPLAFNLLEVFPNNGEVKQIILDLSQSSNSEVRCDAIQRISFHSFQPGSSVETFAWSLQKQALQDSNAKVRSEAFRLFYRSNHILTQDIDELIEIITRDINHTDLSFGAMDAIKSLLKASPHKGNQLLPLLQESCMHENQHIRGEAMATIWFIYEETSMAKEKLLSFISDIWQDCHWDVQHDLLPLLSILEIDCESLSTSLVDAIANGTIEANVNVKDLDRSSDRSLYCSLEVSSENEYSEDESSEDESSNAQARVKCMAHACKEVKEMLFNTTLSEISEKFKDIEKLTQMEILRQIHYRKLLTLETADPIAKMALICEVGRNYITKSCFDYRGIRVPFYLLEEVAKEFVLPANVLKELATGEHRYKSSEGKSYEGRSFNFYFATLIRKQPLDHLLNYYFRSKDDQIVPTIAEKLLLTPITFAEMSESEMKVTLIVGGNVVEQRVSSVEAQMLLSLCKKYYRDDLCFKHIS
eukprot:g2763.t1